MLGLAFLVELFARAGHPYMSKPLISLYCDKGIIGNFNRCKGFCLEEGTLAYVGLSD